MTPRSSAPPHEPAPPQRHTPLATWTAATYPARSGGFDISNYQCGDIPPAPQAISVVQISDGAIDAAPNPCYHQEAVWAGSNLADYIYMDGLPSTAPAESLTGPDGVCAPGDAVCQGYNYGWFWAQRWNSYAQAAGGDPHLWWLDVEANSGWGAVAVNDAVIEGAAMALHSEGHTVGLYSTPYQWSAIAGALTFPGVPTWVSGAGNVAGPGYTAANYCAAHETFAGGSLSLVQWGYTGTFPGAYSGPASSYDRNIACP